MQIFVASLLVFLVAVLAMSIGLLLGRPCLVKGSCGNSGGHDGEQGNGRCACRSSHATGEDEAAE